jgi:hypothetical protein
MKLPSLMTSTEGLGPGVGSSKVKAPMLSCPKFTELPVVALASLCWLTENRTPGARIPVWPHRKL